MRSRALTNTLYARLFVADLFIHGIGGGKYDELTDAIIHRYYGFEPPRFMVLSATLLLPLPRSPARPEHCQRLARELRDLHWNPQRHLADGDATAAELARQKRAWIERQPLDRWTSASKPFSESACASWNDRLEPFVTGREEAVKQELG